MDSTELTKKTNKPDGKPVLCQRTFISAFRAAYLHSYATEFNVECVGPFRELARTGTYIHGELDLTAVFLLSRIGQCM
jgi:hypothetical protein